MRLPRVLSMTKAAGLLAMVVPVFGQTAAFQEGSLHGRRAFVQLDGELGGALPAEIRIVPDALTLLTPEGYGA